MRRSIAPVRAARRLVVAACLVVALPAFADDSGDLAGAIQLFEQGNYLAAQELLLKIDPDALDTSERTRRDEYVNRVQIALAMVEKAETDLEDAETALSGGDLDEAEELLRDVLSNEYAAEALRRGAVDLQRRVAQAREADATEEKTEIRESITVTATATEPAVVVPEDDDTLRARALTQEGEEQMAAGRYAEAERLFQQALEAVPGYPEAIRGIEDLKAYQKVEAGPGSLLERIRGEELVRWQRVVAMYRDAERQVRDLLVADRYDQARQVLLRARQVVEAGKQFADPLTKYESLKSEWTALANYLEDEERRYNENRVARQRHEAAQADRDRHQLIEQNRQQQVDQLMSQAFELRKDRDYSGAIDALRQVQAIEPRNEQVRWMIEILEDKDSYIKQRKHRTDRDRETRDMMREVYESAVPYHDEAPRYPDDWLDIISSPDRAPTGREGLSEEDRIVHNKLDQKIQPVWEDQAFEEVLDELTANINLNVTVIWNDLEASGIDRDTPVTLELPSAVTVKKALEDILELVGGSEVELGYIVSDGVIKIATQDLLDRDVFVDVYDIRDLLMVIPDFSGAPQVDLTRSQSGGGGGGGQDENIFSDDDDDDDEGDDAEREERVLDLLDLIRNTIEPDSWRENGGLVAAIAEMNGQLVVTQTASAHEQVAELLGKLREQQSIQVAIESRFITVQSNYLEEIGLDLDVVLNAGNANFDFLRTAGDAGVSIDPATGARLLLPRSFTRQGFTPAVPGVGNPLSVQIPGSQTGGAGANQNFIQPYGTVGAVPTASGGFQGTTPIPMMSNILDITNPQTLSSDLPGSFAGSNLQPALNVFGSFLDNIQVDFLIRATQADQRSTLLTAPRLVLFNGQRSWVAVVNQQAFVSRLQPQVASGAAAQEPEVSQLTTGAVLDVRATVSADRRYVTMTLRPGVGRLLGLQTFLFTTGPTVGVGASGFLQLPSINVQEINTTVSVPDGGTLLIGGQKLAGEIEIEAGVPVLSKIPILKRLYSSRTMVKDEQVLIILIKPRIIIQKEHERNSFPTLSSRG